MFTFILKGKKTAYSETVKLQGEEAETEKDVPTVQWRRSQTLLKTRRNDLRRRGRRRVHAEEKEWKDYSSKTED